MDPDELSDRRLSFATRVGKVVDALPETRLGRYIAGQLVRCATSPAANYQEGCAAESRADFIHKLSMCLKELREWRTWFRLIIKGGLLTEAQMCGLLDERRQLGKIIAQSLLTAKQVHGKNK